MTDNILQANNLQNTPSLRHAFFTRDWGNLGFSGHQDPQDVHNNRAKAGAHFGISGDAILTAYQIHSPDCVTVDSLWTPEQRPRADALVTNKPNIALGVLTADCVPILLVDPNAKIIGAAHAGWRGALTGIIENTLTAMEKLGGSRKRVRAAIGPCIWQNSYEVGPDFPAPFLAENPDHTRFFCPAFKSDHYMFNLPGYVESKLRGAGVTDIESSLADTCAEPERFFSYRYSSLRNQQRGGNLLSAIMLTGQGKA